MGCCSVKQNDRRNAKQIVAKDPVIVDSVTTATNNSHMEEDNEQFQRYINNLNKTYGFTKYRSKWFNCQQRLKMDEKLYFQAQKYWIQCKVTEIDENRLLGFKFAIIVPQLFNQKEGILKNLLFVYCKQERGKDSNKVIPVIISIEKNRANKEKGIFQFFANLNQIIKLNLKLELKQKPT